MTVILNTRDGIKEVEALKVGELTENEYKRALWVNDTLSRFLETLDRGITHVIYLNVDHELELVRVYYEGGGKRDVNITMDSKAAIVEDIYKQGAIY